jgi:hypothetical protein
MSFPALAILAVFARVFLLPARSVGLKPDLQVSNDRSLNSSR